MICPPCPARPILPAPISPWIERAAGDAPPEEIDEAVDDYQAEATRLHGEQKQELEEEEAIQEAQEAERQRRDRVAEDASTPEGALGGEAELTAMPLLGAASSGPQQAMAA